MRSARLATALLLLAGGAGGAEPAATTSCIACHGDAELFEAEALAVVEAFAGDVHASVGLSCHDCHGGDPDPALADDLAAMDPDHPTLPYRGAPERAAIPAFCGRCHSDPAFMRRYRPDVRVDQEREYRTSQHGLALARGDGDAATCVDCHGAHGVLPVADPDAPVYPTRVADTCATCHADPEHMADHYLPDGRPLPIDQAARWRRSVHARALLEKNDLSAPTCNDCHGNHGAAPPGLDSIAFVCGQCHGREAELFRASGKREGFEEHNEYLADAGEEGCAACHDASEPQAAVDPAHLFTECASCHGNHSVIRPTIAMLGPLPETPCSLCHEGVAPLADEVAERAATARRYLETRDDLLAAATEAGLEGDERFDWLVDRALDLPAHTGAGGDGAVMRPEVGELFTKFRIGKTTFSYPDPATGEEIVERVRRCVDCHAMEPALGEPAGAVAAARFVAGSHQLTALAARAERLLLAARRGGVSVREALVEQEAAVDAEIALEVLVHTFDAGPESAFADQQAEGVEHARAALEHGRQALAELAFRRGGLGLSLLAIVAVLVALALKIRQLPP